MDADLIIRGRNVVLPDAIAPASIHIADGLIINVGPYDGPTGDCDVIDVASPAVVMASAMIVSISSSDACR